ncbi:hypothetical protein UPYG_G00139170 [Umbra pygmaea]|uniref:Uncharacterized protein n=1 Tax=Umbra pygmaea TaxID=75934 RepID=A0ABD0XDA5_UMBPY
MFSIQSKSSVVTQSNEDNQSCCSGREYVSSDPGELSHSTQQGLRYGFLRVLDGFVRSVILYRNGPKWETREAEGLPSGHKPPINTAPGSPTQC